MKAIEVNFDIYVGAAFNESVSCFQDQAETDPYDFTDYAGMCSILDKYGDDGTVQGSITIDFNSDPSDGEVIFRMAKADTANLVPGEYVHDTLLWASSADEEEVWFRGVVVVHPRGTVRT